MADSKTLGTDWRQRLATRMATLGWTQIRLSEEMEVSQGTINHWLSGRREPSLDTLARLSRVLNMTPAELIAGVSREKAQIMENMTLEKLRAAYATMVTLHQQSQDRDSRGGG